MSHPDQILVDVVGAQIPIPQVDINCGNKRFRFVISEELKQGKRFSLAIFFSKGLYDDSFFNYPIEQRIAYLAESPLDMSDDQVTDLVRRFSVIFTHQRGHCSKGDSFVLLYFGTNWISILDSDDTQAIQEHHPPKTALVSFVGSINHPDAGAYRFRQEVVEYLLPRQDVSCFGKGIKEIPGKIEAIAPFRFSIAMENAASDYYFTEKLVDCLLLETVPIYFGCPSITDLFDERGLIQFNNIDELDDILNRLDDELYMSMKPFVLANKQKVIENKWHNHEGIFARIAEKIPKDMCAHKPRKYQEKNRFLKLKYKLQETIRRSFF